MIAILKKSHFFLLVAVLQCLGGCSNCGIDDDDENVGVVKVAPVADDYVLMLPH